MTTRPPTPRGSRGGARPEDAGDEPFARAGPPATTGRYLVLLRQDALEEGARLIARVTGRRPVRTAGAGHAEAAQLEGPGPVVFDALGVAVMALDEAQQRELQVMAEGDSPILAIEPERVLNALAESPARTPTARPLQPEGFRIPPNALILQHQKSSELFIYVTGGQVDLYPPFVGALHAPKADVRIHGQGEIFGAVTGQTIANDAKLAVHFDRALPYLTRGPRIEFRLLGWSDAAPGAVR